MEDLNKAIELDSRYSEAYGTRGNVYLKTGNREQCHCGFSKGLRFGDKKGWTVLRTVSRLDASRHFGTLLS